MAAEMDQFILQYQVELKDAVARLEKLNETVDKVSKKPSEAKKEFAEFSREAGNEIGRLIPGMDRLGLAVGTVTAGFTAAAAGAAALGVGIMSVIRLRDQFNQQRQVGMDTGISTLRLEDLERKFVTQSNGNITREQTRTNLGNISGFVRRAYSDPERMGPENRLMRMLGMNPGALGGDMLSTKDAMVQLSSRFQNMDPAHVQGVADQLGIDKDFALTMAKLGPEIGNITRLTMEEVEMRQKAEQNLKELNGGLAQLGENFNNLQIALGATLLPTLTDFVSKVNEIVGVINKFIPQADSFLSKHVFNDDATDFRSKALHGLPGIGPMMGAWDMYQKNKDVLPSPSAFGNTVSGLPATSLLASPVSGSAQFGIVQRLLDRMPWSKNNGEDKVVSPLVNQKADSAMAIAEENVKSATASQMTVDEIVDNADRNNRTGLQTASQMALAVNMFSGAVSTFTNAVDERQAWAAWAGEIGRAGGIGQTVESSRPGAGQTDRMPDYASRSSTGNYDPITGMRGGQGAVALSTITGTNHSKYDSIFEEAGRMYGIDPNRLKAQAQVESGMNPNAKSAADAMGLMQLIPPTAKALGVTDPMDPRQSIMGGAKLMRENLDRAKGDWRQALLMYHGGLDRKNWGPLTNSYPDKVLRELNALVNEDGNRIIREEIAPPGSIGKDHLWMRSPIDGVQQPPTADERQYRAEDAYKVGGESRAKIINNQVQQNIAEKLGFPLPQIQHGAIRRDDVAWRLEQYDKQLQNEIYRLKKELGNQMLPDRDRARLNEELREQETGLRAMRRFGPGVLDNAAPGPREVTIGERAIQININGVDKPYETAQEVQNRLQSSLSEITNGAADGVMY